MAGQPKRRAMIAELERRTRLEFGDEPASHLDYAEQWVASGRTILALAADLSKSCGAEIFREALSKYLNGLEHEASEGTLARARERAAHALVEESLEIADGATEDDIQVARLRAQTRQWMAERYNQRELGQKNGPVIAISLHGMALDAFRQRELEPAKVTVALPAPDSTVSCDEAQEVEVIGT